MNEMNFLIGSHNCKTACLSAEKDQPKLSKRIIRRTIPDALGNDC